jgi:alkylation response protein AidB-like acyl-CoA dehydrogenase
MEAPVTVDSLLDRVREIAPIIREHAMSAEQERRLAQPVVDAMVKAGLFRLWTPKAFGGLEIDPMTAFQVFEEVSRLDSAAGWNLQLATGVVPNLAWFPDEGAAEIFSKTPDVILGGALHPPGQAVPVQGGYRLAGRWPFVSGCHYCAWFLDPAFIMDGDHPRLGKNGAPMHIVTLCAAEDAEILDTWQTVGMRGTGSHDVAVTDVFIPERRTTILQPLEMPGKAYQGPLYRFTIWHSVAALAAPALGIARASIDELLDLAKGKIPRYTHTTLRERQVVQAQVAQAEALLGAARAYLYEALREVWETAVQAKLIDLEQKIKLQLAATHAARTAADVVDLVHTAAGTTAIRNEHQLQRHVRDVHVITQHAFISASRYESVGQLLLGLEPDWSFFTL